MTILNEALNRVRDLVNTDLTYGQLGTATTGSNATDTGLINPDSTTLLALGTTTVVDKGLKLTYTLPSTGGGTATYTEFELDRTTGTSILTNYDRIVFTGLSFVPNGPEDLVVSKKYFFKSV